MYLRGKYVKIRWQKLKPSNKKSNENMMKARKSTEKIDQINNNRDPTSLRGSFWSDLKWRKWFNSGDLMLVIGNPNNWLKNESNSSNLKLTEIFFLINLHSTFLYELHNWKFHFSFSKTTFVFFKLSRQVKEHYFSEVHIFSESELIKYFKKF